MMVKSGKHAASKRWRDLVVFTVVGLLILLAAGGVIVWQIVKPKPLDPVTLCPEGGPRGQYVLLVDKTDPLNFTQKQAFNVALSELLRKRLPEGYLLSVFSLGEDFTEHAEPIFERCSPGDGSGKSEISNTLPLLKAQFEKRFMEPLMAEASSLEASQPAKYSPIFEMLQLVGINGFRKHGVQGEKRLIIMSDMLHNTVSFSMYKRTVDFVAFKESPYVRKSMPSLRDVDVEILMLMNAPQLQTNRNYLFWKEYFEQAGARIVKVVPLEG